MKCNIIYTLRIAVALVSLCSIFSSCQKDEFSNKNEDSIGQKLTLSVTCNDFAADSTATRAYDKPYFYTNFTKGDTLGLYVVRDGKIVYDNIPFISDENENGEIIQEQVGNTELRSNAKKDSYFIYYPYKKGIDKSILNATATEDSDFFANLITNWEVKNDQSDYATGYTASDLMTGKGRTDPEFTKDNQIGISARLTHRMSLIVVELPAHVYELYYQGVKQSNNYEVYPSDVRFQAGYYKFCNLYPGQYRFIINPEKAKNATQYTVDWGWSTSTKRYTYNIDLSDIERNCYRQFSYQNPGNTEEYDLQEGDLYMNDGLLVSKDKDLSGAGGGAIKSNILGVVFSVGHNENDMTDYSETGIGTEKCHGYVVTRRMVCPSNLVTWSSNITSAIGCWPRLNNEIDGEYNKGTGSAHSVVKDWSGYTWTQMIIKANGGTDKLAGNYDAAYYATQMRSNGGIIYADYVKAPASSSGYFLPAKEQVAEVLYFEESSGIGKTTQTNIGYTRLSDNDQWSSTEVMPWQYNEYAIVVTKSEDIVMATQGTKNTKKAEARPFLAF